MENKVAIVTGGTRGIGRAIVTAFAKAGAQVAFWGTNAALGQEIEKELGSKVRFFSVDVSKGEAVESAVKEVITAFGGIDILVNNAGITRDNLLLRMSEEQWQEVIDINLKSVFLTSKAVLRPMMKAKKGKIINISSIVGLVGNAGQTNYAASKAGMIGFTKAFAKEYASRNICANCIAPGFIETAMTDALPEEQKAAFLKQIPLQRFGKCEEIAALTLFLAGSGGDYITGQVIAMDGGLAIA